MFNILPGFPLDGGRVLRAVLWARSHDFERATRGASRAGHAFGYLMIAGGVVLAITGRLVEGIWTGFIGWVLVQASQAAYQQVVTTRRLSGITVRRMMTEPRGWVPPFVTLEAAAHDYFLARNARCLPVEGELDEFDGVVCLSDLQRRPRSEWNRDRVNDVMTPRDKVVTVGPDEPAAQALQLMAERNVNQVAVVAGEKLLGFVDRAAAIEYMRLHETVGGATPGTSDTASSSAGERRHRVARPTDTTGDDAAETRQPARRGLTPAPTLRPYLRARAAPPRARRRRGGRRRSPSRPRRPRRQDRSPAERPAHTSSFNRRPPNSSPSSRASVTPSVNTTTTASGGKHDLVGRVGDLARRCRPARRRLPGTG